MPIHHKQHLLREDSDHISPRSVPADDASLDSVAYQQVREVADCVLGSLAKLPLLGFASKPKMQKKSPPLLNYLA